MKNILKFVSFTGLILTILPAVFVFTGTIELQLHKWLMLIGTIMWFGTAPLWINKQKGAQG